MRFEYTVHAEERIRKRKLDKLLIEDIIKNPSTVTILKYGRLIAQRAFKQKLLRVVYEKREGIYIIVTAYYTEYKRYK